MKINNNPPGPFCFSSDYGWSIKPNLGGLLSVDTVNAGITIRYSGRNSNFTFDVKTDKNKALNLSASGSW
jgi:hypothetical protein